MSEGSSVRQPSQPKAEAPDFQQIEEQVDAELREDEFDLKDVKITHVENLFIISYLTKALQDILIRRISFLQYPLLLIDLPLALAILIVNVERVLYVKVLGYVLAHIQFDVEILKDLVKSSGQTDEEVEGWQEWAFRAIRKFLRFLWGLLILLFILPVWPLIWIYNHIVEALLICAIYYLLMFWSFDYTGGYLVFYLLFMTVTFLVSSITVPFLFKLWVYIKAIFSLEKKSWRAVSNEAKMAFLQFYRYVQGGGSQSIRAIKARYGEKYQAEGGVYYMLLKLLHYLKDRFWELKERKAEVVVEKIQHKTLEFVDEYYQEKTAYDSTLRALKPKDLQRTALAMLLTLFLSVVLVSHGSHGQGVIGPILLSFVDQDVAGQIWVDQNNGVGYYQDMVHHYFFLPNIFSYVALGADTTLDYFFRGYYAFYPIYLDFILRYYGYYFGILVLGLWGE
ncbi:MAG: hypothetical protein Q8P95_02765 [bacterium]|nr:hypothetical protein [bacterium]